jgi:multiple antibiotic resistance protein
MGGLYRYKQEVLHYMPQSILSMAVLLFFMANPIGNVAAFVSLVKDFDFRHQRWILFREGLFSAVLAFMFLFIGEKFLNTILIEQYSLTLSGGILVLLISLNMIFPQHEEQKGSKATPKEPYIVPIATPLISGGGVFTLVMIMSKQAPILNVALAISLAWTVIVPIVVFSAYLQIVLGKRGLIAVEQLMGMLLLGLGMHLFITGLHAFIEQAHHITLTTLSN